jgi:hypothetical protein
MLSIGLVIVQIFICSWSLGPTVEMGCFLTVTLILKTLLPQHALPMGCSLWFGNELEFAWVGVERQPSD